jgi:sporulation protein YlmC with PRC-barrel domain
MEENMLTRVAIGLLAGTLLSAPVLAQTSPAPSTTAPAGSSTAPAMNQSSAAMPGSGIQYITEGRPDMWRASQLDGVNVYNQNNERIGEVDDVLVDKQGKIEAVVIGVGGFLGIGERRVAVPFNSLQWQMEEPRTAANTGAAGTGTTATGGAGMGAGGTTGAGTTGAPATTGTVAGQPAGGANTGTAANNTADAPARAILANATKDQLQQAPEFRYSR